MLTLEDELTTISTEMCPVRLTASSQKAYKETIGKEVTTIINAILNSGHGGTLQLLYKSAPQRKQVDACVRVMEQKIEDMIGTVTSVSKIKFKAIPHQIRIIVKPADGPFVMNYNLYFPTKSQVKAIPSSESAERVREILNRRSDQPVRKALKPGFQDFVKNGNTTCDEDTNIQWKSLKSEASKRKTLADRIVSKSNKFPCYVSAFANRSGGHIYYGINDDGIVEGEKVTEQDELDITAKVTKTIEKMVWPKHCGGPRKGKEWDIFFVPVKDHGGHVIESTFVIVVAVARCPGGVFTDMPESYHIENGKVQRTSAVSWTDYFAATFEAIPEAVPSKMPLLTWSSAKNRQIYQFLTTKLVQFRNDKNTKKFTMLCDMAVRKYPSSCARLVVMAEKAAIACKNNQFRQAKRLLNDFSATLHGCRGVEGDALFFDVRGLCLWSRIERAEGNYEKSYKVAKDGLQKMQSVKAEFLTVWFYIHTAAVATILSTKERDPQRYNSLVNESNTYLEAALRDSDTLDEQQFPRSTADLKQKLRIYMAMARLGGSLTGDIVAGRHVTTLDIDKAASGLKAVQRSVLDGIQPTHFQEIEYLLAQSDLCYRRSTLSACSKKRTNDLKWAFELCKEAQCLAQELHFQEAVHYASTRLARLTEILLRDAFLKSRGKRAFEELNDLINFS